MPRGDKFKYTAKQERKAEHIEGSYEARGASPEEAEARAWATVNKQSGGGEKAGAGTRKSPAAKGAARKDSARRAVATRKGAASAGGRGATDKGRELENLRMDELRKRASAKGIPGRSGMRKQQLIDALRAA